MDRTGIAELRLCEGYVPQYKEMVELSRPLIEIMIDELGTKEVLRRFSDPLWFQCLACALGFEHNYTGATTVTLKAIKESFSSSPEFFVLGGKGKNALMTPTEIEKYEEKGIIKHKTAQKIKESSRETVKCDNALLQDSYDIYFHAIISDGRRFTIINQGMSTTYQLVRRYHWYNPHSYEDKESRSPITQVALNILEDKEIRNTMTDLIRDESSHKLHRKMVVLSKTFSLLKKGIKPLHISKEELEFFKKVFSLPYYLHFPRKLEKEALEIAHQTTTQFRDLLMQRNIGKSTLRGLAYLSSLIYGKDLLWENPQRYCYAYGTKAAKPWYVEKKEMHKTAQFLKEIVTSSPIHKKKKLEILRRLNKIVETNTRNL